MVLDPTLNGENMRFWLTFFIGFVFAHFLSIWHEEDIIQQLKAWSFRMWKHLVYTQSNSDTTARWSSITFFLIHLQLTQDTVVCAAQALPWHLQGALTYSYNKQKLCMALLNWICPNFIKILSWDLKNYFSFESAYSLPHVCATQVFKWSDQKQLRQTESNPAYFVNGQVKPVVPCLYQIL
jgi:hypothetical protein